eukprot:CAMPEP_0117545182 /NCGR_PEP_ID=MMETSP0784-20121206/45963_1 /TAXON_ID=39447 /ORGANISM="" /LENGTH=198 /DNA_ID=CAMNT_0005342021 /DNA_START=657 /DNA_END=1254 /DNA_ORIENTATION=+
MRKVALRRQLLHDEHVLIVCVDAVELARIGKAYCCEVRQDADVEPRPLQRLWIFRIEVLCRLPDPCQRHPFHRVLRLCVFALHQVHTPLITRSILKGFDKGELAGRPLVQFGCGIRGAVQVVLHDGDHVAIGDRPRWRLSGETDAGPGRSIAARAAALAAAFAMAPILCGCSAGLVQIPFAPADLFGAVATHGDAFLS